MESNKYKIPDDIIDTLFSNEKAKKDHKELTEYLFNNIPKENCKEALKLTLESFKREIFDTNMDLKNIIIHGDISPIMSMAEAIQMFDPDPKFYFILFKPIFDLFKEKLESKQITHFTTTITNFIAKNMDIPLANFNELFEVSILLKINQDQDVKNAGNSLDKLLKESLLYYSNNIEKCESIFDNGAFCDKIKEKLSLQQSYIIVDLLVNWIEIICKIKKPWVVRFLLDTLPLILKIQNASKNADNCLKIIIKNFEKSFSIYYKDNKELLEKIILITIKEASPKANNINMIAWNLLNLFMKKCELHLMIYLSRIKGNIDFMESANINSLNTESSINDNNIIRSAATYKEGKTKPSINFQQKDKNVKFGLEKAIGTNSTKTNSIEKKNSKKLKSSNTRNNGPSFEFKNYNSIQTLHGELGYKEGLFSKDDDILKYIPFSLFSNLLLLITETYPFDIKNFEVVENLNNTIKNIVDKSPNNIRDYGFVVEDITEIILIAIKGPSMRNKEQLLEWCKILYKKFKKGLFTNFNAFIKEYIQSLPDNKNNIFLDMVDFLCNIEMDKELIIIIIKNLTEKLMSNPELMNNESLVILIIEKLSKNSSLNLVYESFSEVLGDNKNYTFISKMVNYLNQYLISDPNGFKFRKSLINKENEENNELFFKLYKIWSFNPISLIVFCVITEHFELTYNIILNVIKIQLDNEYYIHLGQLVQLLESDLYDYIRIRLLEPTKNIYLIKALYGILMLLPQGQAFNVLSNRMCNVQALFEIESGFDNIKEEEDNKEEINQFIEIFLNNQKLKREAEEKNIKHA